MTTSTMTAMAGTPEAPQQTRGFKKKERTRRQLVDAAIEEIARSGEAFTVLDVTKRADVSNGTFYNYFDDRDALLDAVIGEVLVAFTDTSAELVAIEDPVQRFATITALVLEHNAANPQLATVLLRMQSLTLSDALDVDPFEHLRSDLDEAFAAGRLRRQPTDAAIDLVTGTLFRATLRLTTVGADRSYRQDVVRLLLEAFGLDADEAASISSDAVDAAPDFDVAYQQTNG